MIFKLLLTVAISAASICMVQGIFQGQNAILNDNRYVVHIHINDVFACTGALVGKMHVATVAACFELPIPNINVLDVSGNTLSPAKSGTPVKVVQIYPHQQFNKMTLVYNVAVLKLAGEIPEAVPIKLCSGGLNSNVPVRLFGWGDLDENEKRAEFLQQVDNILVNKDKCNVELSGTGINSRSMTCTNSSTAAGMCAFDKGGPMVNSANELCGLMSWREGCGSTAMPTVHTNINVVKLFILASKRR